MKCEMFVYFFFFSSRRRHTRWPRDWSSDVCSSDLTGLTGIITYTRSIHYKLEILYKRFLFIISKIYSVFLFLSYTKRTAKNLCKLFCYGFKCVNLDIEQLVTCYLTDRK